MRTPWNKGFTKHTHPSVLRMSKTMKMKKTDNFAAWRSKMKSKGKIPSSYPKFPKNALLAELIGVILGDGHIRKFPRTEELSIFSNSNNPGFINRYSKLIKDVFSKTPSITKHGSKNCTRIRIYQKHIAERLDLPFSPRGRLKIQIPRWISNNDANIVRYLRGLYEAEGSYCVHQPTHTYKMLFSNRNRSMLENVYFLVAKLGFHPHLGKNQVQISRKAEVKEFLKLIQFRKY